MSDCPFSLKELLRDRERYIKRLESARRRYNDARFTVIGCEQAIRLYYPEHEFELTDTMPPRRSTNIGESA